jgi:hypothetical protein
MDLLSSAPSINVAMKGLGAMVTSDSANAKLLKMAARNWPIVGLVGLAYGTRLWSRRKDGTLTWFNATVDLGMCMTPMVGLFLIRNLAKDSDNLEKMVQSAPAPKAVNPLPVDGGVSGMPGVVDEPVAFQRAPLPVVEPQADGSRIVRKVI